MTAATALVLLLIGVLVVLLLVHRTDGDLARAVAEYTVVALLAMLLAFTPATQGATAGLTAGVTSGSAAAGRLVADAWRAAVTHDPTPTSAAPAPTRPKPDSQRPARRVAPPGSTTTPATRQADRHASVPVGLLLIVLVVLAVLLLSARRIRRLDDLDALDLGLTRQPRGRGRRRVA
jgi:hypothetical protein